MTKPNRIKRALLASALSAGLISTQSASADVTGPGTLNGDLWQSTAEFFLSFSFAAEAINESNNIRPFLIPQARSHGLTTFRDQAIALISGPNIWMPMATLIMILTGPFPHCPCMGL